MSKANDNSSSVQGVNVASVANSASALSQDPSVDADVEINAAESAVNARSGGQLRSSLSLSPIAREHLSFSLSPGPGPMANGGALQRMRPG